MNFTFDEMVEETAISLDRTIICGDCLEVMPTLEENSIDSIVTDPPYGLSFMGSEWDYGVPGVAFWKEALRVAKPGAHLLAFGGTRTHHRLAVAIEDAGWEIRDTIGWMYFSGFPKSCNIKKCLEKKYGTTSKTQYCLRPVSETNLSQTESNKKTKGKVLQPLLSEQSLHTTESLACDVWCKESCLERRSDLQANSWELRNCQICTLSERILCHGQERWLCNGTPFGYGTACWSSTSKNRSCSSYRPQNPEQLNKQSDAISNKPSPQDIRSWEGWGTGLKPAWEPIIVARKPIEKGLTIAENVVKWGTGGINVDGCRVSLPEGDSTKRKPSQQPASTDLALNHCKTIGSITDDWKKGRFPANLIHDGSEEVTRLFPNSKSAKFPTRERKPHTTLFEGMNKDYIGGGYDDDGSAARFFYCAKASKKDRDEGCENLPENIHQSGMAMPMPIDDDGNDRDRFTAISRNGHPTVKPTTLMSYLCRLVTPPSGLVLDPFAGSGSTGKACKQEGFRFVGIEMNEEYCTIARARIE